MPTSNINVVFLTGNLTRDPDLKQTGAGVSVCELRLATNSSYKKDGVWESKPNYFQINVWGKQGENCEKYLSKGSKIGLVGRLEWQKWQDAKDPDKTNSRVVIVAQEVEFLSAPKKGTDTADVAPSSDDGPDF